jgi:hypothetical protein
MLKQYSEFDMWKYVKIHRGEFTKWVRIVNFLNFKEGDTRIGDFWI